MRKNNYFPLSLRNILFKKNDFFSQNRKFFHKILFHFWMFSETIFCLFELRKFLRKKWFFPHNSKFWTKFSCWQKFFSRIFFFNFISRAVWVTKSCFFIKLKNFFWKKRGKKCNWKLFFWKKEKKRFFFWKNRINHYIKIPVILGKTYCDRKKVPKNVKNLKKIDFLLKKTDKIAIFFIIRAQNVQFGFQKFNFWKSVCTSQMSTK